MVKFPFVQILLKIVRTFGTLTLYKILISESFVCKYPWKKIGEDCVRIIDELKSWEESRNHCQSLDGDLATPTLVKEVAEWAEESRSTLQKCRLDS